LFSPAQNSLVNVKVISLIFGTATADSRFSNIST